MMVCMCMSQETLSPALFAAISTTDCRSVMGAYLCGCCDLVAADTYEAAVNGTCEAVCSSDSGNSVACGAPSPGAGPYLGATGPAPASGPDIGLPSGPGRSMRTSNTVLLADSLPEAPAASETFGGDGEEYELERGSWSM